MRYYIATHWNLEFVFGIFKENGCKYKVIHLSIAILKGKIFNHLLIYLCSVGYPPNFA